MRMLGGRWERAREEKYGKSIASERASVENKETLIGKEAPIALLVGLSEPPAFSLSHKPH